jgi:hypothetical protein
MLDLLDFVLRFFRHSGKRQVDSVLNVLKSTLAELESGIAKIEGAVAGNEAAADARLSAAQAFQARKVAENVELLAAARQAQAVHTKVSELLR